MVIDISKRNVLCFKPRPHMPFPHPRTQMGGQPPNAISPLIETELWDKEQTNPWDVLSPMVPELVSLGHILTPPGRVKEKRYRFEDLPFFANNFRTKKDSGIIQAPSCFSLRDASKHIFFDLGRTI